MASTNDAYASEGKTYNRKIWSRECAALARTRPSGLDAVWLSSNNFTELRPSVCMFRKIWVPETDEASLNQKRTELKRLTLLSKIVELPRKQPREALELLHMLSDHGHQVDVINLDYCIHYCPNVERTLEFILRYNLLRPGGLLFLTVARITQANQSRNLGLKTMSTKIERVLEQIESEFKLTGVDRETIDGFPYAYKGEHRNSCPMFSFGWKIYPIKEQQMSNTLNVREKQLIVRLRKSGVGTNVIANAFNVTSGTVSAVLAHDTMRPGLYNTAKKAA